MSVILDNQPGGNEGLSRFLAYETYFFLSLCKHL